MKTFLAFLLGIALFGLSACDKDCDHPDDLPLCIQAQLAVFSTQACEGASLRSYRFQGETVYVFFDGECISDAGAYVFDEDCEALCTLLGIAHLTECNGDDFFETATEETVLWEK